MRHEVKAIGDLDYCCVINACGVVKALEDLGFTNCLYDSEFKSLFIRAGRKRKLFSALDFPDEHPKSKFIVPQDIFDLLPKTKKVTLELTDEQIESLKQQGIL